LQFFFVFVVWATFFCLWTLATLIGLNVRAVTRQGITVEPQQIVTIALYLPFFFPLALSHLTEIQIRAILVVHGDHVLDALCAHQYEPDDARAFQCAHDEGP